MARISVLAELLMLLVMLGLAISAQMELGLAWWLLLLGPALWLYAHATCLRVPYYRSWISSTLVCGVLSLACIVATVLPGEDPFGTLAALFMTVSLFTSLLYWRSVAVLVDDPRPRRNLTMLIALPVFGTLLCFAISFLFVGMIFVYIFWLAMYSSALHGLSTALENQP